ncbi:hypothetical protein [Burkholderia plantarii]|uniref:hypothetical protein n=1 Tax=Burkholderia plantarii TaxID=41899 RepID=UPI00114CD6A2|nr:hypothetical protein [Burkholderia plantarii]WLE58675.1 hypothetical protein GIY62_16365 [Burkholderia plantarii]
MKPEAECIKRARSPVTASGIGAMRRVGGDLSEVLIGPGMLVVATSKRQGRPQGPPFLHLPLDRETIIRFVYLIDPAAIRGRRDAIDHG